jgi:hypothetical protein
MTKNSRLALTSTRAPHDRGIHATCKNHRSCGACDVVSNWSRHGEMEYSGQLFANGTRILDMTEVHDNVSEANISAVKVRREP